MQGGSHKKIVLLLCVSLLAILLVQAFWLRNFYIEKKERFEASVYSGLDQIVSRLNQRDQLRVIKERGDSLLETKKKMTRVLSRKKSNRKTVSTTTIVQSNGSSFIVNDKTVLIATNPSKLAMATAPYVFKVDSEIQVMAGKKMPQLNKKMQEIAFSFQSVESDYQKMDAEYQKMEAEYQKKNAEYQKMEADLQMKKAMAMAYAPVPEQPWIDSVREAEIEELMGRVITEIHINDEELAHPDSLKRLISTILLSKGITIPFEFSLRKLKDGKEQVLVQSKGYDTTQGSFSADLSSKRIFTNNNHLFLQFPDQDNHVLGSMKSSFLLSLLFTGIILSVFYFTVKLILRQKKLSDIRTDFVNNMTHELKTPIATISLAVDAMQHPQVRASEERYNEYTRILKEENAKLNSHVERVLQLALFDKGQLEINRKKTDVAAITEAHVKTYRLQAEAKGLQLFFTHSGPSFVIFADEEHLGSAISNLIDNAIKYTDKNGLVNVSVTSDENRITVSVSDTGPGIAKGELEKVFDKFYRISNNNVHDVKGFGIGLSYVKSIVEAHGGTISVESDPGKGSTFKITLGRND